MRALKTFLRNKKNRCCEGNKCVLVGMWRDFQNYPEFCNCGDGGSTPPVPPTPGFTYSLEKTSTRGATDTYTASKYDNTNTLVKAYSFSVKYDNEDRIDEFKIGDCTGECIWKEESNGESHSDSLKQFYVNPTEAALTAGTQSAYKDIFDSYEEFYSNDENYFYSVDEHEYEESGYLNKSYSFNKEEYDISEQEPGEYSRFSLLLRYDSSTGDLTYAGIADEGDSGNWTDIPDSSQALALKAKYDSIVANFSQAACKEGFEDAKALYDSLQ